MPAALRRRSHSGLEGGLRREDGVPVRAHVRFRAGVVVMTHW